MQENKLLWIPKIIIIVLILYISLLSLSVLSGEAPLMTKIIKLYIRLIPSLFFIIIYANTKKFPVFSGILFIFAGAAFAFFDKTLLDFLTISLPLAIAGVLFIVFHYFPKENNR